MMSRGCSPSILNTTVIAIYTDSILCVCVNKCEQGTCVKQHYGYGMKKMVYIKMAFRVKWQVAL